MQFFSYRQNSNISDQSKFTFNFSYSKKLSGVKGNLHSAILKTVNKPASSSIDGTVLLCSLRRLLKSKKQLIAIAYRH